MTVPAPYGKCMGFTIGTKQRCKQDAKFTFKVYSTVYSESPIDDAPDGSVLHLCGAHAKGNGLIRRMGAAVQQIFPARFLDELDAALENPDQELRTVENCKYFLKQIGLSQQGSREELLLRVQRWREGMLVIWPRAILPPPILPL